MFRLAVWLCLATRARGDGLLVLTSPGYAAVGVGEALVFEVVDASGAAAAPVVRVGGEVAEALRRAMTPVELLRTPLNPRVTSTHSYGVLPPPTPRERRPLTAPSSPSTARSGLTFTSTGHRLAEMSPHGWQAPRT